VIVAITGDRNWVDADAIVEALGTLSPRQDRVVLGDARGADRLAAYACVALGLEHSVHQAKWAVYGGAAGPHRNAQMLADGPPDQVWYFHDDLARSKGTRNCVEQARRLGIAVRDGRMVGDGTQE
jgi:hypothetical protein